MKLRWKILITIALGILASYLFGCGTTQSEIVEHHASTHGPVQEALILAYSSFNESYFFDALPERKTTIILGDLSTLNDMALIEHRSDDTWLITIDPEMHATEKQAEMSLLHEMCHQEDKIAGADEGLDSHSNAFEGCMLSIAKQGGFKGLW